MKTLILVSVLLLGFSPAFAQESPTPSVRVEIQERIKEGVREFKERVREGTLERRGEIKENPAKQRAEFKSEVRDLRNSSQEEIRARKEESKVISEERKEEFKTRLEEARKTAKDKLEKRKEELKERLNQVRDEQKARKVEKVAEQLNALNERMINHFSEVLVRFEKVLVNIKSRTDKAESKGWDVSAVRTMLTSAEQAIASARAAIEAQAAKTYTPEITGEENRLKVEVGQARQALHKDIVAVREKVRAAKEAVRRVATTLAQIPRIDDDDDVSPTPTPTPSPTP